MDLEKILILDFGGQYSKLIAERSDFAVMKAVKGMLPKGALGNQMYRKLFVYCGPEHKHAAQKPEELVF